MIEILQKFKSKVEALANRFRKQVVQPIMVENKPSPGRVKKIRACKAYADQRQKAKHNRRRKPSRAMKNLYQL